MRVHSLQGGIGTERGIDESTGPDKCAGAINSNIRSFE